MRDGCPFCDYDGPSEVLYREHGVYVIEPINPVTPGHVLVIPEAHVEDFTDDVRMRDLSVTWGERTFAMAAGWARDTVKGDCNLIASKGVFATQTVPHLHVHVVPRREDDGLRLPWSKPPDPFAVADRVIAADSEGRMRPEQWTHARELIARAVKSVG